MLLALVLEVSGVKGVAASASTSIGPNGSKPSRSERVESTLVDADPAMFRQPCLGGPPGCPALP